MKVPRRTYGVALQKPSLPATVPILGLGCSSFSTFFWTADDSDNNNKNEKKNDWSADGLDRNHPKVQEWIATIHEAVFKYGINLLDTAPWYGHGTSEVVIGWAIENLKRGDIILNTKVGRYEADPQRQFDFSKAATLSSVQRSIQRMNCTYIDVLQLHDPEFAPSMDQLMTETIPAMIECREKGWCKALGMTGYPLEVQHDILQQSYATFGENVFDQSLTYGHYNLHNQSLLSRPFIVKSSTTAVNNDNEKESLLTFGEYCSKENMGLLAAAPLSMGLLHDNETPEWHPANEELKKACLEAATFCKQKKVDIAALAILFALSEPRIGCTLLGMKNREELQKGATMAMRFHESSPSSAADQTRKAVLSTLEFETIQELMNGPLGQTNLGTSYQWDGVAAAKEFWSTVHSET